MLLYSFKRCTPVIRRTNVYFNVTKLFYNNGAICFTNNPKSNFLLPNLTTNSMQLKTVVRLENTNSDVKKKSIPEPEIKTVPLSKVDKLKKAVKEYGTTVLVFHITLSLISLGTCYLLVSTGLDVNAVFDYLGVLEWSSQSTIVASAGTFAVAYAVHKVFAPVRITITLAAVPFIVRYLRKVGFIKK